MSLAPATFIGHRRAGEPSPLRCESIYPPSLCDRHHSNLAFDSCRYNEMAGLVTVRARNAGATRGNKGKRPVTRRQEGGPGAAIRMG
jgi:hypothetical protein